MDEISVLDYLKFKLNPKNFGKEILPAENPLYAETPEAEESGKKSFAEKCPRWQPLVKTRLNPLFLLLSLLFALTAQLVLEPTIFSRTRLTPMIGGGLYGLSALSFLFSFLMRNMGDDGEAEEPTDAEPETAADTGLQPDPEMAMVMDGDCAAEPAAEENEPEFASDIRFEFLALSLVCAMAAFLLFGGNRFSFLNVTVWILSLIFAGLAYSRPDFSELGGRIRSGISRLSPAHFSLRFSLSAWNVLWLVVFGLCAFFLFHDLDGVPVDMVSDHAEKLYDIKDILDGERPIFFTRNTGREFFQFYFTALIIKVFGTGLTFLSLKIGTALAGLFILPFVYLLGKRLGNRWVGLLAMLLCGISYWPIVIQRAGLRFAYYPMFTAPALYYLIKGCRERSRGSLILSGIFLGIGLHGYSPMRIVPIVFAVFFILFLLIDVRPGKRLNACMAFLSLILFAFLVFLPLARVIMDMPEMVLYRSLSRIGETEKAFDASPLGIFADNVRKGILMPFWDNGATWVHSIMSRPSLEHVTASFFFLGLLFFLLRILKERRWEDLCMVFSIPLLMLPSTLSLAFPAENPCLNRTAGALIPVMIIAAAGFCCVFDVLARAARRSLPLFTGTALLACFLLIAVGLNNYDLIFRRFAYQYNRSAWNTEQIGTVIRGFADSIGSYDEAYVIPYPHWVDTRLVGINAGDPGKDYSFAASLLETLPNDGKPRLFIYRDIDTEAGDAVRTRYPNGVEQFYTGPYSGKDFYSYIAFSGVN